MNPSEYNPIPDPGLERLADRLDALGEAEAGSMPAGLEDRLLGEVGRVFAPTPIAIATGRPAWHRRAPVRAAAGLALLAGVAGLVLMQTGPKTPTTPARGEVVSVALVEQRIEGLLALTDESDAFGDQVASIELWADALGAEAGTAWASESEFEGAM